MDTTFGRMPMSAPVGPSSSAAPKQNVLPPRVRDLSTVERFSDVVIVSNDCGQGATVVVTAPAAIETAGVALDNAGDGLTALVLARVEGGTEASVPVLVEAFRGGRRVGVAHLSL